MYETELLGTIVSWGNAMIYLKEEEKICKNFVLFIGLSEF